MRYFKSGKVYHIPPGPELDQIMHLIKSAHKTSHNLTHDLSYGGTPSSNSFDPPIYPETKIGAMFIENSDTRLGNFDLVCTFGREDLE